MSFLIKGMELPKSCWDCPFCLDFEFLDPYECAAENKEFENGIDEYEHSRPNWCPLVPIPPHGDLIDRDALLKTNNPVGKAMVFGGQYVYTENEIQVAPTIIEAEDGKIEK